ncbi:MAG: phosphatidate cytidylyltransferase [Ignavibacteria bacterium]|nr:phosphatidate cytidylyltransferase [Ignavibacteria bacterium]
MTELSKRVLVAIVGIPITLGIIYLGGITFFVVILILSNLVIRELFHLFENFGYKAYSYFGMLITSTLLIIFYMFLQDSIRINQFTLSLLFLTVLSILPFILLIKQIWSKGSYSTINSALSILGTFFITFSFISILAFRHLTEFFLFLGYFGTVGLPNTYFGISQLISDEWNAKLFIAILGTIWICDTSAYFAGRAFGVKKLAPKISPKKTWVGAIFGFFGALFGFFLLNWVLNLSLPFTFQIAFAIIIGIIGQLGDLAESKIKREAKVKDSSNYLPGHGGLLDRLDSILFVFPTLLAFILLSIVFK